MPHNNKLNFTKQLVCDAMGLCKSYLKKSLTVQTKGNDRDMVTNIDKNIETYIIEKIAQTYPHDTIVAEESVQHAHTNTDSDTWFIDPIDGTTNLVHGFPSYCISIGIWQNNTPYIGVVGEIYHNQLFYAQKGTGAFLNDKPIHVSIVKDAKKSLFCTGFPYHDPLHKKTMNLFSHHIVHSHGIRRQGSAAYDLCLVAMGACEGFYEHGLNPWDVAAGSVLVAEAGGYVTDWEMDANWLYGKRIIASNRHTHQYLLDAITCYFSSQEKKSLNT